MSSLPPSVTASAVTFCGLPTSTLTWKNGVPTPIVWSCAPSAAATWSIQHNALDAGTCAPGTVTVTMTADNSAPAQTSQPATQMESQSTSATPPISTGSASPTGSVPPTESAPPTGSGSDSSTGSASPTGAVSPTGSAPPTGSSSEPPTGSSSEPPAGSSSEPPTGSSSEPPAGSSSEHPAGSSSASFAGSASATGSVPPAGSSSEPPTGSSSEPPTGSSSASPINSASPTGSESASATGSASPTGSESASPTGSTLSTGSATSTKPPTSSEFTSGSRTTSKARSSTTTYDPLAASEATQFVLGASTRICTESKTLIHKSMSIPTGVIYIRNNGPGWGPVGTIWNFTTGAGAKLVKFSADCVGSSCSGITGNEAKNGYMKQRSDGSWYMNVTEGMQPSLNIQGALVEDTTGQRRRVARGQKKFPFEVVGKPYCGLEVANNCTSKSFKFDEDQWGAYQTDLHMKEYLHNKTRPINNLDQFRKTVLDEYYSGIDADKRKCDITSGDQFDCSTPGWEESCRTEPDEYQVRGAMMTTSIIGFTDYLHGMYSTINKLQASLGDAVDEMIPTYWQPAAQQSWSKILSLEGALIGLMTAVATIVSIAQPELAGPLLVAATAFASAGVNIAASVGNLDDPGQTDTLFDKSTKYRGGAATMIQNTVDGFEAFYKHDIGPDTIQSIVGSAHWVGDKSWSYFNDQGVGANVTSWYEKALIGRLISKILYDTGFFILHVPYGKNVEYKGKKWGFTKGECEKRWLGDNHWKFWAACEQTYGSDESTEGMTLFALTGDKGPQTYDMIKSFSYKDVTISPLDLIQSAMSGQADHGFDYSILNKDIANDISHKSGAEAKEAFMKLPSNQPGLVTIPVCVIDDLVNVPGVDQVYMDQDDAYDAKTYFHSTDPCSCKSFTEKFKNGTVGNFIDYVNDDTKDSLKSCKTGGVHRTTRGRY